jgi:hypothetical protein
LRIWNLSTLDDLERPVVLKFQQHLKQRKISGSSRLRTTLRVAAVAVAVTAAGMFSYPKVSVESLSLSSDVSIVAQSIARLTPPLADLFAERFSEEWSVQNEQAALDAMAATYSQKPVEIDEAELLDVVQANQQESFATDAPRLSPTEVLKFTKKRRSA